MSLIAELDLADQSELTDELSQLTYQIDLTDQSELTDQSDDQSTEPEIVNRADLVDPTQSVEIDFDGLDGLDTNDLNFEKYAELDSGHYDGHRCGHQNDRDSSLEHELICEIRDNPERYTLDFVKENEVFRFACMSGFLDFAKFLKNRFKLTSKDVCVRAHAPIGEPIGNDLADSMVGAVDPPYLSALHLACCSNHLHVAQWLADEFDFDATDIAFNNYAMFETVCRKGYLAMAKWIAEYFRIDQNVDMTDIFIIICRYGQLSTAQWIVEYFAPTDQYIMTHLVASSAALQWACFNGYLEVVKWLIDHYNYTADNIRADDDIILKLTFQAKQTAVIEWLIERFDTPPRGQFEQYQTDISTVAGI
jgi:hypothetical protein